MAPQAWLRLGLRCMSSAGPYYERYLRWLKGGLPRHEAYLERAGAHHKARAYLQARADARAAVEAVEALQRVSFLQVKFQ